MDLSEGIDAVRPGYEISVALQILSFAAPGTIRGDHGCTVDYNLLHASDSIDSADVEINRFSEERIHISTAQKMYVN